MINRFIGQMAFYMLMAPDDGGNQGGGGGTGGTGNQGGTGGAGSGGNQGGGNADTAKLIESLQASNKTLLERLEKLEKGAPPPKDPEDPSLADKVRKAREEEDRKAGDAKTLETAIKFEVQGPEWIKTNAALLPKTIPGIFEQANKENYGNAIEKANAIKVGIVSEFFAQQANLDLLTDNQKIQLEDFKKLTKNDKQARVQAIYDNLFEPSFEQLKRVKKAELLGKGLGNPTNVESAYTEKMKALAKKHYLKERK